MGRHDITRGALILAGGILVFGIGVSLARERGGLAAGAPLQGATPPERASPSWAPRDLVPPGPGEVVGERAPARLRPFRVVATADGAKAYLSLEGREGRPRAEVLVIDPIARAITGRIAVGSAPQGLALHPSGRWLLVTNRYSNFVSVIDTRSERAVAQIPVPFYCEDVVIAADGRRAYLSNFWKDQVIVVDLREEEGSLAGAMVERGFDREAFFGRERVETETVSRCPECGWLSERATRCPHCGSPKVVAEPRERRIREELGVETILRDRCGSAGCHLYRAGGFVAGPEHEENLRAATVLAFPEAPAESPLLRATTAVAHGGWADGVDGRHHPGGVVFEDPAGDPDYARISSWIAGGSDGPGVRVGTDPRDLLLSRDGATLYVANTGSLDVSVVDLATLRETRRIFTRSPVNDLAWVGDELLFSTLGVGSGHPARHDPGRESLDPEGPETEFTLRRDFTTGKPLPLAQQHPLGPFDEVDGTAQTKFRDITNDLVVLSPLAEQVAAYQASELFTRYTSDSFEALVGDAKGDVPSELMKVVGAFPEQMVVAGDRVYVAMSGTFQVQEWRYDGAAPPAGRLSPLRVFDTGLEPTGLALAGRTLIVADHLGDGVTFVDLDSGEGSSLALEPAAPRFPTGDFERGELFVQTSVFSVDQDQGCVHCHYRDTSDGKRWSVSQVMGQSRDGQERTGGSREVPDLRNLAAEVPFFSEGTLTVDEPLTMMMEHNPLIDFAGPAPAGDYSQVFADAGERERFARSADTIVVATGVPLAGTTLTLADLVARRERHVESISRRYFGEAVDFRELQRVIGVYQRDDARLLPNPVDPDDPMVARGRALFMSPETGCSGCHPPPTFTDKVHVHNQNRAFPPLVTPAPRDDSHTLVSADRLDSIMGYVREWDRADPGRVEEHEGFFVAPSLRGLWARPPRLLHHGGSVSLREVVSPPGHSALRRRSLGRAEAERPEGRERGLNEREGLLDTHGTTSQLGVWDLECLLAFLGSIE